MRIKYIPNEETLWSVGVEFFASLHCHLDLRLFGNKIFESDFHLAEHLLHFPSFVAQVTTFVDDGVFGSLDSKNTC